MSLRCSESFVSHCTPTAYLEALDYSTTTPYVEDGLHRRDLPGGQASLTLRLHTTSYFTPSPTSIPPPTSTHIHDTHHDLTNLHYTIFPEFLFPTTTVCDVDDLLAFSTHDTTHRLIYLGPLACWKTETSRTTPSGKSCESFTGVLGRRHEFALGFYLRHIIPL